MNAPMTTSMRAREVNIMQATVEVPQIKQQFNSNC